jgi:hypothetical protein
MKRNIPKLTQQDTATIEKRSVECDKQRNVAIDEKWRMLFWFSAVMFTGTQFMVANMVHLQQHEQIILAVETATDLEYQSVNSNPLHSSQRALRVVINHFEEANSDGQSETKDAPSAMNDDPSFIRKNAFNFMDQVQLLHEFDTEKEEDDDDEPFPTDLYFEGVDPVLWPIVYKGKMYSTCRGDRSGSFIADMLYAHSFAFAHNVTYGGSCCVTSGLPKADTRKLVKDLQWNEVIPFKCPKGVNNKVYNIVRPNATSINPLMLNPDVYRLQGEKSNFKPAWKESIHGALQGFSDQKEHSRFEIAVHIRRGEVTPCTYKRRYLPNDHYMQLIDKYTPSASELNGRPVHVTIYSESDTFEPFDVFVERNYTLELDTENLSDVWRALSTADVAILSRSYFSIVPAIMNPNTVVATDFYDFDVKMEGWEYADLALEKASDYTTNEFYCTQCNHTATVRGCENRDEVDEEDDEPLPPDLYYEGVDPVLWPVLHKGKMYSVCRGDRSGSFIADMLYAHSFAFAHNITYAGNCCVTRGLPKADTRNLVEDLQWNNILPFKCPKGVNNKVYNLFHPNATTINPLMLNPEVYRLQGEMSNFKPAWKESIREALLDYSDQSENRPFEIAVHIRRGDVSPCTYKRRYLPNDHYMQLIDKYTPSATELNGRPVHVTIYSESDTFEPFDVFVERNYTMELDTENLSQVWYALSTADVAILSRSYFSIVPAIINPNTVVATEFFEFDVTVMEGWEYADVELVKATDDKNREIYCTQCNHTEKVSSCEDRDEKEVTDIEEDEPLPSDLYYEGIDPVLWPVLHQGKMYSVCRGDRSGSFIADMLYAHSFAFAHNITYAGNCCVTRGLPKAPTSNLIEDLHWNKVIPFQCPKGVNNKVYNVLYPNATTINPLMLNPEVYRLQGEMSNFKPAWKESIREAFLDYSDQSENRPFEIAVHIRRGDVTPCTYKRRYLPNDHYMQLIDKYTPSATELNGRPIHVTIYSESDTFEPFDVFVERNYTLELDTENLSQVWYALSTADVAILSRSYFSIVPAIINPNTVVATEFFEFDVKVMEGWEYADQELVKASDEKNREIYDTQCNSTKKTIV